MQLGNSVQFPTAKHGTDVEPKPFRHLVRVSIFPGFAIYHRFQQKLMDLRPPLRLEWRAMVPDAVPLMQAWEFSDPTPVHSSLFALRCDWQFSYTIGQHLDKR